MKADLRQRQPLLTEPAPLPPSPPVWPAALAARGKDQLRSAVPEHLAGRLDGPTRDAHGGSGLVTRPTLFQLPAVSVVVLELEGLCQDAVCLPTTTGLSDTVRTVQTLANRARRLGEALAAVRAEREPVLNGWLFVPQDGCRCLLCGEEAERRDAGGVPACGPCRSERCRRVREALAVVEKCIKLPLSP
jgi:hypothetical protein